MNDERKTFISYVTILCTAYIQMGLLAESIESQYLKHICWHLMILGAEVLSGRGCFKIPFHFALTLVPSLVLCWQNFVYGDWCLFRT
jgi:hypothetical protein